MSRRAPRSRRLARLAPLLGLLVAGVPPFTADHLAVSAQEAPALVVDDAQTANPELVEVAVGDPADFGIARQTLRVPPGYSVNVVAANLGGPRFMAFDDADNLIVGAARQGTVFRFPYADGRLGEPEVLASGLQQPASVAIFTADGVQYLYVGETNQVSRFPYDPSGPVGEQEVVIPNLPTEGAHRTRTVAFGPDGMLYLAVGSSCNICVEEQPIRATVSRANPDGSDLEIYRHRAAQPGRTRLPTRDRSALGDGERARQPGQRDPARSGHDRYRGCELWLAGLSAARCHPPGARSRLLRCDPTNRRHPGALRAARSRLPRRGGSSRVISMATSSSPSMDPGTGSHRPRRSCC